MLKAFYFCITSFLFFNNFCLAQIPSASPDTLRVIEIMRGKSLREKSIDSVNKIETIAGDVLIRERSTKFSCDSAIIDRKQNTIEAFGNVHINDADSLHTYAQYLKYYGDTRIAHLKKDVRLNDTKGTLFTQDLDYDLAAGIGKYHNGGKVINGSTILTSKDGVYYADTKDVYFKNNVDLTDPKYKIKADSLLYNTLSQVVTFTGPTYIKSKNADIYTTQGTYDLKNGNAFFGIRSLITDSSHRIYQADRIALDEKGGFAELEGSAVIKDSVNGVIVTANHIYLDNKNSSFLATNKPVMIIQQEKDSIYISADTLFSGFKTQVANELPEGKKDSLKGDMITKDSLKINFLKRDSLKRDSSKTELLKIDSLKTDSSKTYFSNKKPSADKIPEIAKSDSATVKNETDTSSKPLPDVKKLIQINFPASDSLVNIPDKPGFPILNKQDTSINLPTDSSGKIIKPLSFSNDTLGVDTLKGTGVVKLNKQDTSIRYFLAFHHVRIFNDSLQSVCDSLFFSGQDSVFRLFYNPVVWSGESQITGDTIYLFTKNKKPERLYVFENGLIVNKNKKEFYNQISGKTINAYFKNGVIDYARVKGQKAESIYYIQDQDSAFVGMNRATGDVIDLYFKEGGLNKVKFINDVHGVMHPIKQIPDDQKFLNNFKWEDKRRPKNKLELFE